MLKALNDAWSGRVSLAKAMLLYGVGITSGLALTQFFPSFDYVMQFVIFAWIIVSLKITWSASRRSGHGYVKAAALLLSQVVLNVVPVIVIAVVALMFSMRMGPGSHAYANLPSMERKVPQRITDEYGIGMPAEYAVRYVSSWDYGEEFGIDFVVEVSREELNRWISEVHPFGEPFQKGVQSNFPQFSIEWLCNAPPPGQEWREKLVIEDPEVSAAVCGLLGQRREVYWASREVRADWIVEITIFEDERLIWFHEVET